MAMRFRIEVRVEWRDQGKPYSSNSLIYSVAPGQSQVNWQTEKVLSVDQLKKLVDTLTSSHGMTILIEMHYASMLFPVQRNIDFLSMQFKDWSTSNVLLTTTCKDLTVSQSTALTPHLVDLAKSQLGITLDMDVTKTKVVTLTTQDTFTKSP
jgi:hypothetical protein